MVSLGDIQTVVRGGANAKKAQGLMRYFKVGKGQYGQGDKFLGVDVPTLRVIARRYQDLGLPATERLLHSQFHEERELALMIMVLKSKQADRALREKLYSLYLASTKYINNWDLVDGSAEYIVGKYLEDKPKAPLSTLARSQSLWERRIAIVATYWYIKRGKSQETLRIGEILLSDPHDLIHKAVGWMLREVGKRCSMGAEEAFLKNNYRHMPRTMLRYAIERFPQEKRIAYLHGTI